MDESKKAAKAFVDQYFPIKDPNPKSADLWADLFSPNSSKPESPIKERHAAQSLNPQMVDSDGKSQGGLHKSQNTAQKGNDGVEHREISEPCLMSSSVDYGCRDDYPYNPDNRYPGPSPHIGKEDKKEGYEYKNPGNSGAEWWQGRLIADAAEGRHGCYATD